MPRFPLSPRDDRPGPPPVLFLPSKRYIAALAGAALLSLGLALFLRYGVIQNTPIGLTCEAGERSMTCGLRVAVIILFLKEVFGWTAIIAAAIQLVRPNHVTFAVGLMAAAFGLILYNTRLSALAVGLLLLSLARAVPQDRRASKGARAQQR
jgi:hypothetical protein